MNPGRWNKIKRYKITLVLLAVSIVVYIISLPQPLFKDPYSTLLEDKDGNLLSGAIAPDGQWRFPEQAYLPEKFKTAIILFEDKRFDSHFGIDFLSIGRAFKQNIDSGRIVSGGSTLTMQTIRLSRKGRPRSVFEKVIEVILATRLEWSYSKDEILSMYAAHAPFGGNVVGIEAASWRYFGRDLDQLSWGEACLLAVLPNNPSLIHLGKNRKILKAKRDRLIVRLGAAGEIDEITTQLAKEEPLPEAPLPLPRLAKHLLNRSYADGYAQSRVHSTIDREIQIRAEQIVNEHFETLRANQVFNAAALILKVSTGEVITYVGNTNSGSEHSDKVDIISAARSTGSILKPFLFAAMMDEGKLLPQTLVPDIPTIISGFSPKNFSHDYDGAVAADQALIRSLNIPAVYELRDYRYEKFYDVLQHVGLTTLNKPPDHYGLSLVLGGAEGTLWDITGSYASMARSLNNYFELAGKSRYRKSDFHAPTYTSSDIINSDELEANGWLSASSIWLTFEALEDLYRPGEETGWRYFNSSKKIAWKTGTSFGFRDGWAVGVNPEYAVGVWVGNADGEGRPGLTGTSTAAPILFDLFDLLPGQSWFQKPSSEMEEIAVCTKSGQRASAHCEKVNLTWVSRQGLQTEACGYHQNIYLSENGKFQVNSSCEPLTRMRQEKWFVLPPVQAYYYKAKNLSYKPLPPVRSDCSSSSLLSTMDLIYPKSNASIFIPKELDGTPGVSLFQVAHTSQNAIIYWHLDGNYLGQTQHQHQLALNPPQGQHVLTLVDGEGEVLERSFQVISNR